MLDVLADRLDSGLFGAPLDHAATTFHDLLPDWDWTPGPALADLDRFEVSASDQVHFLKNVVTLRVLARRGRRELFGTFLELKRPRENTSPRRMRTIARLLNERARWRQFEEVPSPVPIPIPLVTVDVFADDDLDVAGD